MVIRTGQDRTTSTHGTGFNLDTWDRQDRQVRDERQDRQIWHLNLTFQVTCVGQLSQFLRCFIIPLTWSCFNFYFPFKWRASGVSSKAGTWVKNCCILNLGACFSHSHIPYHYFNTKHGVASFQFSILYAPISFLGANCQCRLTTAIWPHLMLLSWNSWITDVNDRAKLKFNKSKAEGNYRLTNYYTEEGRLWLWCPIRG